MDYLKTKLQIVFPLIFRESVELKDRHKRRSIVVETKVLLGSQNRLLFSPKALIKQGRRRETCAKIRKITFLDFSNMNNLKTKLQTMFDLIFRKSLEPKDRRKRKGIVAETKLCMEAKMVLKNLKNIYCFQDADFVSSTYVSWRCKRGNIWETFPCFLTHVTYVEDAKFASRKQKMCCFLTVCSTKQT